MKKFDTRPSNLGELTHVVEKHYEIFAYNDECKIWIVYKRYKRHHWESPALGIVDYPGEDITPEEFNELLTLEKL